MIIKLKLCVVKNCIVYILKSEDDGCMSNEQIITQIDDIIEILRTNGDVPREKLGNLVNWIESVLDKLKLKTLVVEPKKLLEPTKSLTRDKIKDYAEKANDFLGWREISFQLMTDTYENYEEVGKIFSKAKEKIPEVLEEETKLKHLAEIRAENYVKIIKKSLNLVSKYKDMTRKYNPEDIGSLISSLHWLKTSLIILDKLMKGLKGFKPASQIADETNQHTFDKNLNIKQRFAAVGKFLSSVKKVLDGKEYPKQLSKFRMRERHVYEGKEWIESNVPEGTAEVVTERTRLYQDYMIGRLNNLNDAIISFETNYDASSIKEAAFGEIFEYLKKSEILMARFAAEVITINDFLTIQTTSNNKLRNLSNCILDAVLKHKEHSELDVFGWDCFRYYDKYKSSSFANETMRMKCFESLHEKICCEAADKFLDAYIEGQFMLGLAENDRFPLNVHAHDKGFPYALRLVSDSGSFIRKNDRIDALKGVNQLKDDRKSISGIQLLDAVLYDYVGISLGGNKAFKFTGSTWRMYEVYRPLELEPEKQEEIIQMLLNATTKILKMQCRNMTIEDLLVDKIIGKEMDTVQVDGKKPL